MARVEGQEVSAELERVWSPVAMAEVGTDGRLPFYQMGNNRYHDEILDLALERPGVLTLHDVSLHHLVLERTIGRGLLQPYRDWLALDHGWWGEACAEPPRWGPIGKVQLFSMHCHARLLRSQRGILVHSRWAADMIREELPDLEIRVVPMPMPLEEPIEGDGAELRRSLGIPASAPVLGSFGFQTPIKRTDAVIRALTRPELADAHLVVVGESSRAFDLATLARVLGVAERVHLLGWVEREVLSQAMALADLCVNLRYPTAGETSASLLRLLALGRPTVVSRYAQFAELPEDCVVHVPIGEHEVEELARRVRALLEQPEELARMGRRARRRMRDENDPQRAAAAIAAAIAELAELQPPGAAPVRVRRPSNLTTGRHPGELRVEGADGRWRDGERRALRVELRNTGSCRWLGQRRGLGSVALLTFLRDEHDRDLLEESHPWIGLPHDLEPGAAVQLTVTVRRPRGQVKLYLVPVMDIGTDVRAIQVERFEAWI